MKTIRTFTSLISCVVLLFAVLLPLTRSRAQQPPPAPTPTATTVAAPAKPAGPTMAKDMSLWDWFVVGGWCMWPLLACSVVGLGFSIRNYIVLKNKKLLRPDLMPSLLEAMQNLDIAQARKICKTNSCLFTEIFDSGLERAETAGIDIAAMEKAMEEASVEQMSSYMVPINAVNTVAVVAPMWGLLGTVSGMIKAFFNISLGGMGKPEMLANNIGEALITTEAGLLIAIPAMTFYFLFKNNFIKAVAQSGKQIGKLTDMLRVSAEKAVKDGTADIRD